MIAIELPYPCRSLWPNGRAHYMEKARETAKHRRWAKTSIMAVNGTERHREAVQAVDVLITVYPKPRGPMPDQDGVVGASKAYLDGIADALGLNDRTFNAPRVQFAERCAQGKFVISLTERVCEARSIGELIKPIIARIQIVDEAA